MTIGMMMVVVMTFDPDPDRDLDYRHPSPCISRLPVQRSLRPVGSRTRRRAPLRFLRMRPGLHLVEFFFSDGGWPARRVAWCFSAFLLLPSAAWLSMCAWLHAGFAFFPRCISSLGVAWP